MTLLRLFHASSTLAILTFIFAHTSFLNRSSAATRPALSPPQFLQLQSQRLFRLTASRPQLAFARLDILPIESKAQKEAWLAAVYRHKLVDASAYPRALSDRRLLYALLMNHLGEKVDRFFPHTIGLKEFLNENHLVDATGKWLPNVDADTIEEALIHTFPSGFIARPAAGLAATETRQGLFASSADFVEELLKPTSKLFKSADYMYPTRSSLLNEILSGEAVVLQESIIGRAHIHRPLKTRTYSRVRIHCYETKILEEAIATRWALQGTKASVADQERAQKFVQDFLDSLPKNLLTRQAWGVDVAVFDNGDLRIFDIITNRGLPIAWSSYLEQPQVLGAYTRHFEQVAQVQWMGVSGILLRHDWANYGSYIWRATEHGLASMFHF